VILLVQEAVFENDGHSSSSQNPVVTLIFRSSMGRIVSFFTGISYCSGPLSVIVSVRVASAAVPFATVSVWADSFLTLRSLC